MRTLPALIFLAASLNLGLYDLRAQSGLPLRWEVPGPEASAGFGFSLDRVADLNGDGFDDFISGAPYLGDDHGGAALLSGKDGVILGAKVGRAASEQLGWSVAALGDFDGDGVSDWAASAPMANGGGRVSIYSGQTSGLVTDLFAGASGDRFGYALAGCGDVNGDGFQDLAVGVPFWRNAVGDQLGKVGIYLGPNGVLWDEFIGLQIDSIFGSALSTCGDVDGDGVPELAVGARWEDSLGFSNNGVTRVFSPVTGVQLFDFHGEFGGDQAGVALGGGGDVNADGVPDLLVGAMQNDVGAPNVGRAYAISGATGQLLHVWTGENAQDHIGAAIADAGDMNGDGFDDVVLGGLTFPLGTGQGVVQIYSGFDGSRLFEKFGPSNSSFFGYSVAPGGDLNGDGIADVVVGSLFEPAPGSSIPIGMIRAFSLAGVRPYGRGVGGADALDLSFGPSLDPRPAWGRVQVSGGMPGTIGVVGVSTSDAMASLDGLPVLIDVGPQFLFVTVFSFDGQGEAFQPVTLVEPALAGQSLYLQALGARGQAVTSNGLELRFSR